MVLIKYSSGAMGSIFIARVLESGNAYVYQKLTGVFTVVVGALALLSLVPLIYHH